MMIHLQTIIRIIVSILAVNLFVSLSFGTVTDIDGCTDSSACNYDETATSDDDSCEYYDCAGVCDGSAVIDDCGVCGGNNSVCLFLNISSTIGDLDNQVRLGMHIAAEDAYNNTPYPDYDCGLCYIDIPGPPPPTGEHIRFYFSHAEWVNQNDFSATEFVQDIRSFRDLSNDSVDPSSVWISSIETTSFYPEIISLEFNYGNTNLGGNSLIIGNNGEYTIIENNDTYQFMSTGTINGPSPALQPLEIIICGGEPVIDACGIMCGPGIPDGACDCDGNVLDECGNCGGDCIEDGNGFITCGNSITELEGTWIGYELDGEMGNWTFIVSGDEMYSYSTGVKPEEWYKGTFLINSQENHKEIDVIITDCLYDHFIGNTSLGIYKNEDNTLTLAGNEVGLDIRPDSFVPEGEDNTRVFIMEKQDDVDGDNQIIADCAGECGGSAEVDECGECDSDISNDNECFTHPEEFIDRWEITINEYYTTDCSGITEVKQGIFTFKEDGTSIHEHMDRMGNKYSCQEYPGCEIKSQVSAGICNKDGYCQFQVTENGIWGISNNRFCIMVGGIDYLCSEYIFSDNGESFSITIPSETGCVVLNFIKLRYSFSIEKTVIFDDRTCFAANWRQVESIFETNYISVVNDTVFQVGYQEPNDEPVEKNTIVTPLLPAVGSEWQGMFMGPAHFKAQKLTNIVVPADTALAYIYQIYDADLEKYLGSMTFSNGIGMLSMMQIMGEDTFSIILESYAIEGGNGVFPLAVGNQWIYVDGNYDDIQIQGCTDEEACNYNEHADVNDESCGYPEEGFDCAGNELSIQIQGCTNPEACNYNENANTDSGECTYPEAYYNCEGNCINDVDNNDVCDDIGDVHLEIQNVNVDAGTLDIRMVSDKYVGAVQFKISGVSMTDNTEFMINNPDFAFNPNFELLYQENIIDTIITHNYTNYLGGDICFDTGGVDPPSFEGKGDMNEDGVVNILDLVRLEKCILPESVTQCSNADFDNNGLLNIIDHVAFSNYRLDMNDRTIISSNLDGNPMNTTIGFCYCVSDSNDDGVCDELSLFGRLVPENYGIHNIYPNPFNPITNITYGIPEYANVQIIIYDILGRQVLSLIDEFQFPGYHSVDWYADAHPSGLYFVKMISGEYVNIQKLMLVK